MSDFKAKLKEIAIQGRLALGLSEDATDEEYRKVLAARIDEEEAKIRQNIASKK
jgi:hypothetical protein